MSAWKTVDELLAAYDHAKNVDGYLADWDPDGRIEMLAEEVLRLRRELAERAP